MTFPVDAYAWDNFPMSTVVFWCLAILVLGSGLLVVTAKRVFHAAIAMVACFLGVAGMYALLSCPFMAGLQLLVYVGAISTLIMFAVMMTNKMMEPTPGSITFQPFLGIVASAATLGLLWLIIGNSSFGFEGLATSQASGTSLGNIPQEVTSLDVTSIGIRLMTPYVVPFELISVLILATMIGAIAIARKEERQSEPQTAPESKPSEPTA